VYSEKTEPLVRFFRDRGVLGEVDGVGEVSQIAGRIDEALRVLLERGKA
jgi:adenylate kinase family enzyme